MRALAIVHQRDAGPGVFAEMLADEEVEVETWHPAEGQPVPDSDRYDLTLTFGGAMHVDQDERHPWLEPEKALLARLVDRGAPVLGVCLGAQLVAEAAGTEARPASKPEIGWHRVELTPEAADDPVLGGLPPSFEAFQWHSYEAPLPPGAVALASSPVCLQAYRIGAAAWGIQFHAEVSAVDAQRWVHDYRNDPDAVRIGVDPRALGAETAEKIDAWNEVGRALCRRFLAVAVSPAQLGPG